MAMMASFQKVQAEVVALRAEVVELRSQLKQNSQNSSKPPSSDGPAGQGRGGQGGKKAGRKAGGQAGHQGTNFQPFSADEVKQVVPLLPSECKQCGHAFDGTVNPKGKPRRHQVAELPPFALDVTEYQLHVKRCPCCATKTRASLPEGMGWSPVGPRLAGLVAMLSIQMQLSRRQVGLVLDEALGRRFSAATVQALVERASTAVAPAVEDLREAVAQAPVVHVDETGAWHHGAEKAKGRRSWLWAARAGQWCYFKVSNNRGQEGLAGVLPLSYQGVLVSDRWRVYEKVVGAKRQLCWAHLKRNLQGLLERGVAVGKLPERRALGVQTEAWAEEALAGLGKLFALWRRHKAGEMTRPSLRRRMRRHETAFGKLLDRGEQSQDPRVRGFSADLNRQWRQLWTFVDEEGVEPTNNAAEQAIRLGVMLRKRSGGTRSTAGMVAVGRLLSVVQTLRFQGRSAVRYFAESMVAHGLKQAGPSLVRWQPLGQAT